MDHGGFCGVLPGFLCPPPSHPSRVDKFVFLGKLFLSTLGLNFRSYRRFLFWLRRNIHTISSRPTAALICAGPAPRLILLSFVGRSVGRPPLTRGQRDLVRGGECLLSLSCWGRTHRHGTREEFCCFILTEPREDDESLRVKRFQLSERGVR